MRVTQQLKYAIYGIFDLAYNGSKRPICIQEISDRHGIPARYLEQIFQKLRRGDLVQSKRGPGGGYLLARPADEISLADVIRAVEGDLLVRSDLEPRDEALPAAVVWDWFRGGVEVALEETMLGQLCREAARRGLERADAEPAMYHI